MARKIQVFEDFDDQFLTCPVCMLNYRDPRILPCLHTFCIECLKLWATKQQPMACPTCRKNVTLPQQGVEGLRSNFYVNNLLDFAVVKKGAGPGVPCQVCEGKEEGARSWCVQCAVLLCESCTNMHRKFPAMKGHQILTQDNLKATKCVPATFQRKAFCSKHEDQVLTFYCEPCQTLVCVACALVEHRMDDGHNLVEIGAIAERKKRDLQELLGKVDHRTREAQAALNNVGKEISELPTSTDATIEQATVCFDHLITLLQERKTEVINDIESGRLEVQKSLETQQETIEFELAGLTSASEFCKQALEHGSDAHVIVVEDQARQRVEELLTTPTDLEAPPSKVVFLEGTVVTGLKDNVVKAGRVQVTTNVNASKCSVEIKPAVVEVSSHSFLSTLDKNGHLCFVPKDDVTVTLKDPLGQAVPTQLQERGRGLLEISYTPTVTGNHSLDVKVNGVSLAGTPFDVKVQYNHAPALTIGKHGRGTKEHFGPVDVAVDMAGNIVVVDGKNRRVHVFDGRTGLSLRFFTLVGDERPCGIDVDSNGQYIVTSQASQGVNVIRVYSREGTLTKTVNSDCFRELRGVTVLKDGRMLAVDKQQKSCLLLQPDGSLIRDIGKGQLENPWFVAVDELRDLFYVTDSDANKVLVFDLEGNMKFSFGEVGLCEGQFLCPSGITLDPAGNIIVVNFLGGRLQVFRPDGTYLKTLAEVNTFASGIVLTQDGHIAVACYWEHCVELYYFSCK